ncbi:hypothetical protein GPROT1_01277 [Gammaproteobacteria bacterium]|nr:hypothetical protein GPROT1_01277 [Gammaproteobacteria bacterium]
MARKLVSITYLMTLMILLVACASAPTPDANLIKTQIAGEVSIQLTANAPTPTSTPKPRSKSTYGPIAYDIPPDWCKIRDDLIGTVCPNYTGLPQISIEFSQHSASQSTPAKVIDGYIQSLRDGDFQILDIRNLDSVPDIGGEATTIAYVEFSHPKYDTGPQPMLLVSFTHNSTIFLIAADLAGERTEDSHSYFLDAVLGLLDSIELD